LRVGQVVDHSRLEGTGVVTVDGDRATGHCMQAAQTVDCVDNIMQASEFTPVGITFFHWPWNLIVPNNMVSRSHPFNK